MRPHRGSTRFLTEPDCLPYLSRYKAGSGKGVRWAIEPDFIGRSHLDSIRLDGLVFGDDPDLFVCAVYLFWTIYLILSQGVVG